MEIFPDKREIFHDILKFRDWGKEKLHESNSRHLISYNFN